MAFTRRRTDRGLLRVVHRRRNRLAARDATRAGLVRPRAPDGRRARRPPDPAGHRRRLAARSRHRPHLDAQPDDLRCRDLRRRPQPDDDGVVAGAGAHAAPCRQAARRAGAVRGRARQHQDAAPRVRRARVDMFRGASDLLRHDLRLAFADVSDAALQRELAAAAAAARRAIDGYATELETTVLRSATGTLCDRHGQRRGALSRGRIDRPSRGGAAGDRRT